MGGGVVLRNVKKNTSIPARNLTHYHPVRNLSTLSTEPFWLPVHRLIILYLFTAIVLPPGGSGYFTCKQNMKLVTTRFKSGGLHEKHVVATWSVGNHLSICL